MGCGVVLFSIQGLTFEGKEKTSAEPIRPENRSVIAEREMGQPIACIGKKINTPYNLSE